MSIPISYRKKYILTYIFQAISVILGFASLFIVIPFLSSDKYLFGIYSVCTSISIFFSYADLGFLSASNKYAAEAFIKGNLNEEIKIVGFTSYIMLVVFSLLAILILIIGLKPTIILPELIYGTYQYRVSSTLLIILSISCYIIIAQRILSVIYTIRVDDYKFQAIVICGNAIKILSVFYFFRDTHYLILEYYAFTQFVNLLVVIIGFLKTKKFGYNFFVFIRSIKFNKKIFNKVKTLTGTSLLAMVAMVLYNELDQIVISNYLGIEAVAIYSISFSAASFVRTYLSVLYSPYTSRYNHYIGLNDDASLIKFVRQIISILTPLVVIPIITLSIFSFPFVISWVGETYINSSIILSILVLSYLPNCFRDPINNLLIAKEQNKILRRYNYLLPIIYWIIIGLLIHRFNLLSFALAKTISPLFILVFYMSESKKIISSLGYQIMKNSQYIKLFFTPIIISCVISLLFKQLAVLENTNTALFNNLIIMIVVVFLSLLINLLFNEVLKITFISYTKILFDKIAKK